VSGWWSGRHGDDVGCDRAVELAPDLALGLLDGAERAAVLAHVESCAACRTEVAELTELGERLLELTPDAPPPPGFESRVLGQLAPVQRRRRRRRSRRVLGAAAAVLLAVTGVVTLSLARGGDGDGDGETETAGGPAGRRQEQPDRPGASTTRPTTPAATTALLRTGEGEVVGEAVLHDTGGPAAVEVDVAAWAEQLDQGGEGYGESADGPWWLHVEGPGGFHEMHALAVEASPARVQLEGDAEQVGGVAIVDQSGRAWCWAAFPA
jgi:hypothetical protein